jgi:hypothetical protein
MKNSTICISHPVSFGDKIEKNVIGGACSTCGDGQGLFKVLMGKPKGKRSFGRPRHRLEDYIKMDLQKVECIE